LQQVAGCFPNPKFNRKILITLSVQLELADEADGYCYSATNSSLPAEPENSPNLKYGCKSSGIVNRIKRKATSMPSSYTLPARNEEVGSSCVVHIIGLRAIYAILWRLERTNP
jgi:hypothetical protein